MPLRNLEITGAIDRKYSADPAAGQDPIHVCVIGAGLAGGVLASKLAERGYRVTLIEQGDKPLPSSPQDEDWENGYPRSTFSRGEGLGGTSNYWHAGLMALDRSDVEGASPLGGGPRYPISYAELCRYYREALALFTNGTISLRDLLENGCRPSKVRIDGEAFQLKQLFFAPAPFSTNALIADASRRHGMKVLTGFRVDRLVFGDASQVTHVEGFQEGRTDRSRIAADVFVLCAGGLGSPKILLKSASGSPALRTLPVGRFLTDHPTGFVFKARLRRRIDLREFFDQPHCARFRKRWGFVLKSDYLHVASHRNHVLYLRPALSLRDPNEFDALKRQLLARARKSSPLTALRLLRFADLMLEAVCLRYGLLKTVRYVSGFVLADQFPDFENRMTLGDDHRYKIRWEVSRADRRSVRAFLDAFVARHDGLFERVEFFPQPLASAAHHSGGCRMAARASEGVVDENLRIFGTDNVYVADGSVLPYSGHANTGLTIAALALKCADAVHADASMPAIMS